MTRLRALVVAATIALPIFFSLAALARDRMFWPFSHYPMYSGLTPSSTAVTRAVGVDASGKEWPLPRSVEPNGLHLHIIVEHFRRQPDQAERLTRLSMALEKEYERLQASASDSGPVLASVRIYRDTIALATQPHTHRRTLLAAGPPK